MSTVHQRLSQERGMIVQWTSGPSISSSSSFSTLQRSSIEFPKDSDDINVDKGSHRRATSEGPRSLVKVLDHWLGSMMGCDSDQVPSFRKVNWVLLWCISRYCMLYVY